MQTVLMKSNVVPDNIEAIKESDISTTVSAYSKGVYFVCMGEVYQRTGDSVKWGNVFWNSLSDMCSWGMLRKVS